MTDNTKKLLTTLDKVEENYEPNYGVWKKKEEWETVGKIRNRIRQMYQARQSNCYLTNTDGSASWDNHWDLVEKNYLMYAKFGKEDPQPNLKSGMAYRTITQIDSRERKQQIDFLVEARNESDENEGRAITHRYLFQDYFRRNPDIRYRFFDASKSAKIFGTAIAYIPYSVRVREVMKPETPDIDKKKVKQGELPKMKYKKETRVDFEDVDFVPWNLKDFYIDPSGQCLHGTSHVATDCAGVLYATPAQVRMMFEGDGDVKNLDLITSSNRESFSSPFYKTDRDIESGFCEVIFYYNIETDSEIIIVDDILIKEGPNPYEDKGHPFVAFHLVRHPGHFYGMGIVDAVLQLSAEDAANKNARIRNTRFKIEAPVFVGDTIFGDVDNQLDRIEPGQLVKVTDVNQVKVMATPDIPFDSWRISEELKDEAVMNTGINPQGLSLPMSSTPATNTIAMKETMSDIVNMYMDTLMQGMNHWGQLLESRFCQFYSLPTKKAALELGKKQMRELRLEDIRLYDKEGQMKTAEVKGSQIIRIDKKMFEWTGEPRIYISADFVAPISEAFQMRKAQEILPQLAPFAGEPGAEIKPGTPAVIHIRKLLGWYLDQMKVRDKDLLIDEDEDRINEIKQAQEQQKAMMDGEDVEGIPGEPQAHRYTHAVELMRINSTVGNPEFVEMMSMPDEGVQKFVSALMDYKKKLTEHSQTDNLLAQEAGKVAVEESNAFDQAMSGQGQPGMMPGMMPGMQPEMPRNNAPTVPLVSGAMGLPNEGGIPVPNQVSPSDESGMGMY